MQQFILEDLNETGNHLPLPPEMQDPGILSLSASPFGIKVLVICKIDDRPYGFVQDIICQRANDMLATLDPAILFLESADAQGILKALQEYSPVFEDHKSLWPKLEIDNVLLIAPGSEYYVSPSVREILKQYGSGNSMVGVYTTTNKTLTTYTLDDLAPFACNTASSLYQGERPVFQKLEMGINSPRIDPGPFNFHITKHPDIVKQLEKSRTSNKIFVFGTGAVNRGAVTLVSDQINEGQFGINELGKLRDKYNREKGLKPYKALKFSHICYLLGQRTIPHPVEFVMAHLHCLPDAKVSFLLYDGPNKVTAETWSLKGLVPYQPGRENVIKGLEPYMQAASGIPDTYEPRPS